MVNSKNIYKNFDIATRYKNSIILIGNFDGLHLGHQKLFKLAKKYKKRYSSKIGVLTFEPMPKMFFNKELKNFRISNLDQKYQLLKNLKVDFIINKKFNKKFSKIKSLDFVKNINSEVVCLIGVLEHMNYPREFLNVVKQNKNEIFIPLIKKFIIEIKNNTIYLDTPNGLIELYLKQK